MAKNRTSTSAAGSHPRQPIISLQHLHKEYTVGKRQIQVLQDISLEVFPGEFIILYGPSGSGKSTLLNHILALETPTTGSVAIDGKNITKMSANRLAHLRHQYFGIVFQRPDWIRSISVCENVALPLAIHNTSRHERKERALASLAEVGMKDFARYAPNDLSGGEQQKVALARAMINNPGILIADEPTGNLDSESADRVMASIKELNAKRGLTVILVTHNLDFIHFGTRSCSMRDGVLTEHSV